MAARVELMCAVKKGVSARRKRVESGEMQPNPYRSGTLKHEVFEYGYNNDLDGWLGVFNRRRVADDAGRFKAHETIQITRPGSGAEKGEFVGYAEDGIVKVRSFRFGGVELVPRSWIAHWKVAA